MKVETPQILWNSEEDKGLNAALMSVSMIQSGVVDNSTAQYTNVLATAGNTNIINLWRVHFSPTRAAGPMFQRKTSSTKMEYVCSLTRHDAPVNAVSFSPDGLHLATAGDAGSVIVWSVPVSKRGNGNGRHYWSTVTREADVQVKIVARAGEAVSDISWSADSKRFMAGTIDHSVFVVEDGSHSHNRAHAAQQQDPSWKVVYRNTMDHTHFVQGVAYDPVGVYLASMSSDRTVRVYPRKALKKKKILRRKDNAALPDPQVAATLQDILTEGKLEMAKSKLVKYRRIEQQDEAGNDVQIKRHLYADESTLESFFRRLAWTTDGAFLVTPAALWQPENTTGKQQSSYATYMFARHKFDEPVRVLAGLEKPSVAVRPSPVLFTLPKVAAEASKENASPQTDPSRAAGLPYRSIFAVLTHDTVLVYDTVQSQPLSIIRGLHYSNLSDATWSADGMHLVVCSTDGYISIVNFAEGELGQVYTPPVPVVAQVAAANTSTAALKVDSATTATPVATLPKPTHNVLQATDTLLPPCEEQGESATIEAPPAKKAKKTRITPTLVSAVPPAPSSSAKRPAEDIDAEHMGQAVEGLSLNAEVKPKKKKRIQPVLLTTTLQ